MSRVFLTTFIILLAANEQAFAETPAAATQAPAASEAAPSGSPEIWSKPEPGQAREQTAPTAPAEPTVEPPPAANATAPLPPQDSSPDIWSSPEPGHTRGDTLPPEPPPAGYPPPPRYYRRSWDWHLPDRGDSLTELGFTFGPPTIVNLNLGYWGPKSLPLLFRVSGMYYGDTRGIQFDFGYVFQRDAILRQYVAISAVSWQISSDFYSFRSNNNVSTYKDLFSGVGPTYGLNWRGLSVQAGVAFGQDVNSQSYAGGYYYYGGYTPPSSSNVSQFEPMFTFQIGYTFLW